MLSVQGSMTSSERGGQLRYSWAEESMNLDLYKEKKEETLH